MTRHIGGTFLMTEQDFVAAQKLHIKNTMRIVSSSLVIFAFLFAIAGATGPILWDTLVLIAISGLAGFTSYLSTPYFSKRIYREQKSARDAREFTADVESIQINQESGTLRLLWRDAVKWNESNQVLLIYPARNMMVVIPKTVGEAAIAFIRSKLIDAGLPKPNQRRNS